MSTSQPKRFPLRPVALAVIAVAAIVVLVVVLTGGDDELKIADEIEVGAAPSAVAIGLGGVWVLNADGGTMVKVDPDTKKIVGRPVSIGEAPQFIALGEGSVWTTAGLGSRVVRVDPRTLRIQKTIVAGFWPTGIAVGEGAVWVADARGDNVTRIDPKHQPQGRQADQGRARPASGRRRWRGRLGRELPQRHGLAHRPRQPTGSSRPFRSATGPRTWPTGRAGVWVLNVYDRTVVKIDTAQNKVVGRPVPLGGTPAGMAIGDGLGVGREHRRRDRSSASTRTSRRSTATR